VLDLASLSLCRWGTSGGKCKKVGFNNSDLTTGPDPAFPQGMPASWPCVDAWYEQRMFILNAVQALVVGKSPCAPPMIKAMAEISPGWASGAETKAVSVAVF
jgi:hypothetical protein